MSKIMTASNISLSFKDTKALTNLNFHVEEGEIFGFLGPSGAGKTTTIKLLTGQLKQDSGSVKMFEHDVLAQLDSIYTKIGILSDNSGLYENLSVYENLKLFADIYKLPDTIIAEVLTKIKLAGEEKKQAKKLSRGMKQRLLFARAILHKPKILFLDEPTSALDPATSEAVHEMIMDLNKEGTTVFLTTHNMEEADKLCNRVAFLNHGEIVELGNPAELKLKYAKDEIQIKTKQNHTHVLRKDAQELQELIPMLANEGILTIHSIEPDLKSIFLDITGREL